jgi:MFS transporter, DHA2 family, multidrug resistance protein
MVGLVFGMSEGQPEGWASPITVVPFVSAVIALAVFGWWQTRVSTPLLDLSLFRRMNLLASAISQVPAGMIELGLGYLLPFYLLLVVGSAPLPQESL